MAAPHSSSPRKRRIASSAAARKLIIALVAASALAPLAGCGKPGRPQAPPDTVYPRVYPNPALGPTQPQPQAQPQAQQQQPQPKEGQLTPSGTYIDPSVRATILDAQTRVLPGSNLPNAQPSTGNSPFDQGLGAPTMSPLPPVQPMQPSGLPEEMTPQ